MFIVFYCFSNVEFDFCMFLIIIIEFFKELFYIKKDR